MNPTAATKAGDFVYRFNRREAIRASAIDVPSKKLSGILPYFHLNFEAGLRKAILVSAKALDDLIEIWVRGIHLCELGLLITSSHRIDVLHIEGTERTKALAGIARHAVVVQKGPGVELSIYHARDRRRSMSFCAFNVLRSLKFSAVVEQGLADAGV